MSYAYPIYEDNINKDKVRFYHCSDKKSEVRTIKTDYTSGSILDSDKTLLYQPSYSITTEPNATHKLRLQMIDATIINLYYMDGEWYMGTKNSWNIRNLHDFTSTTYGEFFEECLSLYPTFSYDNLDKTKMYTLLFSNPKCHLFEDEECRVYVYTESDPLANVFDVLPQTDDITNYVLLSEEENTIYIRETKNRELAHSKVYSNRKRMYSKDAKFAVAKTLISAICKCKRHERKHVKKYISQNICEEYRIVWDEIYSMFRVFKSFYRKTEAGVDLNCPIFDEYQLRDMKLPKLVNEEYSEKNIGFFVNLYKVSPKQK